LDTSNWLTYLNEATSEEAVDRGFLKSPSVESLMLLRRLGEVAPTETIKYLVEKKLFGCLAGVVDGWSGVDAEGAFEWLQAHQGELPQVESTWQALSKAAGALVAVDPQAVFTNKDFRLRKEDAVEMTRQVGFQKLSEMLAPRWEKPSGDYWEGRRLADEYEAWDHVIHEDVRKRFPESEAIQEVYANRKRMLENPRLNSGVRFWLQYQVDHSPFK